MTKFIADELAENGLALVVTDVRKNTNICLTLGEPIELPRGMVRIAMWNGHLTALISDVREAAARVAV